MSSTESLSVLVRHLASSGGRISMGDDAALRRMDPLAPDRAAIVAYSLLADRGIPLDHVETVQRWCVLVHTLALARWAHDPSQSMGAALVAINFSEARLAQLLSADFALFADIVPRLARRLTAQQQRMDFAPLTRLLLSVDRYPDDAEKARLEIARSFVIATHLDKEKRKAK
jgi:hypothetical protein